MLVYTTPHALRVEVNENIHCLIITGKDEIRSFYLVNENYGDPVYMFGCKTDSDADAAEIAIANAIDYIPSEW